MPRLHIAHLVAMTAVLVVGCSDDIVQSPTAPSVFVPEAQQPRALQRSLGPSEIVLCLDVSDSVTVAELESVVAALAINLADPALIPGDGSVALAALVYGDSAAAAVDSLVPVTPTSLDQTILPALGALQSDRLVTTATADLAAALGAAQPLLDPGSVSDRHVLVIGSGMVADAVAAETACMALGGAGVMVSAVALGTDAAAAPAFQACADSTGGFFGLGGDDLTGNIGLALAYMLQADLDLEPETADLMRGAEHVVTAAMFRGGDPQAYPLAGETVTFAVVDGPNQGVTSDVVTETDGVATFRYTGDGGPGTDTLVATGTHPGTGATLDDTVTVTWINAPPVCDAGGPYAITITADSMMVTLDAGLSSDAEGDSLGFLWSVDCAEASFDDATAMTPILLLTGSCLCVDSIAVDLTVTDGFDSTACGTVVALDDQRPPVIEVRPEPLELWPPNHKHHRITPEMMIVSAEDACGRPIDLSALTVVEVRSDEPEDAHGNGDGHTVAHIAVECPNTVLLRAERAGSGNGRVYTVVYRLATDSGATADVEAQVIVPHDSSGHGAHEDSGVGYAVEPGCS